MLQDINIFGTELSVTGNFLQDMFDIIRPIGDTYIQYPQQASPNVLFNNGIQSVWEEQLQYDGAFFRAANDIDYVWSSDEGVTCYVIDNQDNLAPVKVIGDVGGDISITLTGSDDRTIDGVLYKKYTVNGATKRANNFINTLDNLNKQAYQNGKHRHTMAHTHSLQSHTHTLTNGTAKASTSATYSYNIFRSSGDTATGLGTGAKGNFKAPSDFISYKTTLSGRTDGPSNNTSGAASDENTSYDNDTSNPEARPDNYTIRIWKRIA